MERHVRVLTCCFKDFKSNHERVANLCRHNVTSCSVGDPHGNVRGADNGRLAVGGIDISVDKNQDKRS